MSFEVLFMVFFCEVPSCMLTKTRSVYQEYYESHQLSSYSPSSIAWIGSLQSFFLFAGAAVTGPLFDRIGAKVYFRRPSTLNRADV